MNTADQASDDSKNRQVAEMNAMGSAAGQPTGEHDMNGYGKQSKLQITTRWTGLGGNTLHFNFDFASSSIVRGIGAFKLGLTNGDVLRRRNRAVLIKSKTSNDEATHTWRVAA